MRRMFLALPLVIFALSFSAAANDDAANPPPASQPAGDDPILSDLDARAAKIVDLSAHFQQRKYTALLKKPLISAGQVRACGNVIRWDTQTPEPSSLYSNGKEMRIYYPNQQLEEIYPIDGKLSGLLASPLPRLASIRDHFHIERGDAGIFAEPAMLPSHLPPIILRLVPTDAALKPHVQEVAVAIDPQSALAVAMQTIDGDGDKTEIFFSDAKTNSGLKADELDLKIPPETTVSHPLEGANPGP